jgi:hypothetical protein
MALLPHPVAIGELELHPNERDEIRTDIDLLLQSNSAEGKLLRVARTPRHTEGSPGEIREVNFFEFGESRRLELSCEAGTLIVETSITTADIQVYDSEQRST